MFRFLFFVSLSVVFWSCSSEELNTRQAGPPLFSLADFISKEKENMVKSNTGLIKILELNGKKDTLILEKPDFAKELEVFIKADINRPASSDQYNIDSTYLRESLLKVTYSALDKKLLTQKLSIQFNSEGKVNRIVVRLFNGNLLAKSSQQLMYQPGIGYQIKDLQYFFGDKDEVKVEGSFQ
jgi:hypothetical protein